MYCQRLTVCAAVALVLLVFWVALAAWQWHEYRHELEMTQATLRRQAESIENALVGGIQSHGRLGPFFEEMTQGALVELASSKDVLAVGIASRPEVGPAEVLLHAGQRELLELSLPTNRSAERFVGEFRLELDPGGGLRGPGGGRGWGRGPRPQVDEKSPFSAGGRYVSILVLDRTQTEAQCHRAFWLRVWVAVAGGGVLICLALVWVATVRLMHTRGRARMLELEARHFRDLSQAAAGLAHETRNPLGLVRGWTQRLVQSDHASLEQQEQARAVIEECDRVTARINQFLAFARPCDPQREQFEAESLVAELAVLLEPDLDAKGLKIECSASEPRTMIHVDRELFRQALFNLITNAIQFAPEKGAVEVCVRIGHDGRRRIEIADRGPGVPVEKVDLLFSPYFTTRSDGTGLGLAIVRRIATAHDWEASYVPRPGGGSIFKLEQIDGR